MGEQTTGGLAWEDGEVINRLKERVKARLRRAVNQSSSIDEPLAHVVVAGGTSTEWADFSAGEWSKRLSQMVHAVEPEGVRWLTVVPVSAGEGISDNDEVNLIANIDKALRHQSSKVELIVRTEPDGRRRFVEVVDQLCAESALRGVHATTSETRLAKALLRPAGVDPDLVLVLGPPHQLPTSLVWELAYSELVFLDIGWRELSVEHLQMAVDDYRRRSRRFGGIDA
jgi:undecaprenyl diphosphate synthase